jgi:hypothetical protein
MFGKIRAKVPQKFSAAFCGVNFNKKYRKSGIYSHWYMAGQISLLHMCNPENKLGPLIWPRNKLYRFLPFYTWVLAKAEQQDQLTSVSNSAKQSNLQVGAYFCLIFIARFFVREPMHRCLSKHKKKPDKLKLSVAEKETPMCANI